MHWLCYPLIAGFAISKWTLIKRKHPTISS